MKFFTLFFIISLISTLTASAQQDAYHWRIGAYSGIMTYYGDLNQRFLSPNKRLIDKPSDALSYGFALEKSLSPAWSTKVLYTNGKFYANDRAIDWDGNAEPENSNYGRSLNARTDIQDLSLMFTYYFDNDNLLGRRSFIAPYLAFGAGVTRFEVMGDLFDETGGRYYYWSDNTIRNEAENSPNAGNAMVIEQDGNYETNLTELETERKYKNRVINIPFGAGLKFRLSSRFNLNLDYTARYAFTDYLDDVSGNYRQQYENDLQAYASNPTGSDMDRRGKSGRNDFYGFISISLHYNFGKKTDNYIAPTIYPSSVYSETDPATESRLHRLQYPEFEFDKVSTAKLIRRPIRRFNPIPIELDSIASLETVVNTPEERQNNEANKVTDVLDIQTEGHDSLTLDEKHLLQDDTIRQLEYEIRKIKLEKELYELQNDFPDSSARTETRVQTDTTAIVEYTPFATRPIYDSMMVKETAEGPGQNVPSKSNARADSSETSVTSTDTLTSVGDNSLNADSTELAKMQNEIEQLKQTLNARQTQANVIREGTITVDTSAISPASRDTLQSRDQNERLNADSLKFSQMQREINDLQRTLNARQTQANVTREETNTADTSANSISSVDTLESRDQNERLNADSVKFSQMQREINDLRQTLNSRQNQANRTSIENTADTSAILNSSLDTLESRDQRKRLIADSIKFSQMQREIDDLQRTLDTRQPEVSSIQKEISELEDTTQVIALPDRRVALSNRKKVVNTDSIQMVNMQRDINELTRTLNARQNQVNQTQGEREALNQLRKRIDALSYELRNRQQVTRVIQREPNRSFQNRRDRQAAMDRDNLERKIDGLSSDVNNLRSNNNNQRSNNTNQDSTALNLLADSKRTQADLSNKINTLNSRLQATAKDDSIAQRRVTAERDSLQAQVTQLQKTLKDLASEKPDTIEREVITIPKLPKTEVFFPVNSSSISETDNRRITEVANIVKKYPQVSVIIRGYTDKTGSLKYNMMLSEKRASAVKKVLTSSNIASARIITESNGVDSDIKNKASQYGRRVEIILSSETQGQ